MRSCYQRVLENLDGGRESVIVARCGSRGVERELADAGHPDDPPEGVRIAFARTADGIVLRERVSPRERLVILGAGHIAVPLAHMGAMLGFDVVVFDDRPSFANAGRFPDATVVCDFFDVLKDRLPVRATDYVAVITRGHRHDQECLRQLLGGVAPRYLGMIGSRRRTRIVREQLAEEGFAPESLGRLFAPIGLDIGAQSPEEVALAILAQMVQQRHAGRPHEAIRQEPAADRDVLEWLAAHGDAPVVLASVLATRGSTPRSAGACMLVTEGGETVGSIGGGCAEGDVIREARRLLRSGGHAVRTVDLAGVAEDEGMVCGGEMEVLLEAHNIVGP
jgi:xanthine dehydrogenase accessory factor